MLFGASHLRSGQSLWWFSGGLLLRFLIRGAACGARHGHGAAVQAAGTSAVPLDVFVIV